MAYLRSNLNERSTVLRVDAALESPTYPAFYTIDSETVKVLSGADTREWKAERGVAESIAASHPADVALVAVDAPFGAGGLPTGWTQDPGAPGGGPGESGVVHAGTGLDLAEDLFTMAVYAGSLGAREGESLSIDTAGGTIDTAGGNVHVSAAPLYGILAPGNLYLANATTHAILAADGTDYGLWLKAKDVTGIGIYMEPSSAAAVIDPNGIPLLVAGARPEVPANPSPQDNTDALVTLGLITQSETGGELNISGISADGQPGAVLSLLADADATHAGSVNLDAGDGGADAWGGSVGLHAGDGDAGASSGAIIELGGGGSDGLYDGEMLLRTGGSTGASGEALVSSNGSTVWGGLIVAEGVPSGAPVGKLPIAYDSTAVSGGTYIWNGAAWVKIATIL